MSVWQRGGETLVVGHRGGRGEGWPPENTIASLERAHVEEADAVEIDIRLSRDGEVVVCHDPDLSRMTGGSDVRWVAALSMAELAKVRLLGSSEGVPTLREVLAWCRERGMAINIELKHDQPDRTRFLVALARVLLQPRVDILLSSFDPALLLAMGPLAPGVPRAWLTDRRHDRALDLAIRLSSPSLFFALHPEHTQCTDARVSRWKTRGFCVGAYTVNDAAEARELARRGVDWIITDTPALTRRALTRS
ncbi:MAG: glycerophosphodiester phosphodiesterase family protein [Polyangiaceae bacterium]